MTRSEIRTAESNTQVLGILAPAVHEAMLTGQLFDLRMLLADTAAGAPELVYLVVTSSEGEIIATSFARKRPLSSRLLFPPTSGAPMIVAPLLLMIAGGPSCTQHLDIGDFDVGALHAGIDAQPMHTTRRSITRRLGALFLVLAVLGMAVAFTMGRFLTDPIRKMTVFAQRIGAGDLAGRMPVVATDELGQLASAFNGMTEQLAESREALVRTEKLAVSGRLAAGVAHEINNPLASLRALLWALRKPNVDAALRKKHLASLDQGLRRIAHIVEHLLAYARPSNVTRTLASLADTARSAVDLVAPSVADSDIAVVFKEPPFAPPVQIDPSRLSKF